MVQRRRIPLKPREEDDYDNAVAYQEAAAAKVEWLDDLIKSALRRGFRVLNRYPDEVIDRLRERINSRDFYGREEAFDIACRLNLYAEHERRYTGPVERRDEDEHDIGDGEETPVAHRDERDDQPHGDDEETNGHDEDQWANHDRRNDGERRVTKTKKSGHRPDGKRKRSKKKPPRNPSRALFDFDQSSGFWLNLYEWEPWILSRALARKSNAADEKPRSNRKQPSVNANVLLTFVWFVHWSAPHKRGKREGEPKAEQRQVATDDNGIHWLLVSRARIAKWFGISEGQVGRAIKTLVDLRLLEVQSEDLPQRYGPNTQYARVRWERIEPIVEDEMATRNQRRKKPKNVKT